MLKHAAEADLRELVPVCGLAPPATPFLWCQTHDSRNSADNATLSFLLPSARR